MAYVVDAGMWAIAIAGALVLLLIVTAGHLVWLFTDWWHRLGRALRSARGAWLQAAAALALTAWLALGHLAFRSGALFAARGAPGIALALCYGAAALSLAIFSLRSRAPTSPALLVCAVGLALACLFCAFAARQAFARLQPIIAASALCAFALAAVLALAAPRK